MREENIKETIDEEYDHISNYVKNSVGDDETRILVSDFAILWNEYEDELFSKGHRINLISNMINGLKIKNIYIVKIEELYNKLVVYIKSKNEFTYNEIVKGYNILIKKAKCDNNGNIMQDKYGNAIYNGGIPKEELKRIMTSDNYLDKLHFMLIIVARVRNNMFHGTKGISDLKYQKELFKTCNAILKLVLDIHRRYML